MRQIITFLAVAAQITILYHLYNLEVNPLTGKPFSNQTVQRSRRNSESASDHVTFNNSSKKRVISLQAGETFDYSGEYRIIRFYKNLGIPQNWTFHDITLASQCSINHMHHVVNLVERWTGPISIAVFAPDQDSSIANYAIDGLRRCFPNVRKLVDFHIVYPATHAGDFGKSGESWAHMECPDLVKKLQDYGKGMNYDMGDMPFPHNVLRNAARTGVTTEYVFLIDIDLTPSVDLREHFVEFVKRKQLIGKRPEPRKRAKLSYGDVSSEMISDVEVEEDLVVWVVPVFEVRKDKAIPRDKKLLLEGVLNDVVRPFHNETCWWCHMPEDFAKWSKIKPGHDLDVAFTAKWDKSWEPFYIARREVPLFDERFKQYGFDRIQQICELYVAGYKFSVLDNAFLAHDGWKIPKQFYAKKESDTAQNWVLFNYHFKDEMQRKYQTSRTCSPVEPWLPPKLRQQGKKPLRGPGQDKIPRVPSISDTLAKFMRALHDKSIKDPYNLDDVVDKSANKLNTRGFNSEVVDEEIKVNSNSQVKGSDESSEKREKNEISDSFLNQEEDFNNSEQGFDVPESNLDPDSLSWE